MSKLVPEVAQLIREGRLPPYDGDWIKNLAPENQLAAAEKMMRVDTHKPILDSPRMRINDGFSTGRSRAGRA